VALASRYAVPAIYAHQEFAAVLALDHLRAHGVEITFQEDRQGGVLNGPRAYFHGSRRHGIGVYQPHELRRLVLKNA
jgi:hypothetical protein